MESAEAVAADVSRSRSVTIEISNVTKNYCLINPRYVPGMCLGSLMIAVIISQMCFCVCAGQGVP